jgi:predicted phage terminase large subunit-like protein
MTMNFPARNVSDAICRLDFASFIRKCFQTLHPAEFLPNWHIHALAFQLEQVRLGNVKRLNINCPPRTLKSFVCSVAFPAFLLGHDPGKRIIILSYSAELATTLTNEFRKIIEAPWYRMLFPAAFPAGGKNTEFEVATTRNGFRLGASIDGSITGRGGDIIILDDPLKPMDALSDSKRERVNDLYNTTLHSRLDNKQSGAIVVVMQRLHSNDLPGMLRRSVESWTTLSLPAIAQHEETVQIGRNEYHLRRPGEALHPEREPKSVLDSIRATIGGEPFAAQYQQEPIPPGGNMIQRAWVRRYSRLPERNSSSFVMQSWDTASKDGRMNDYSACTTWLIHERRWYLMEVLRQRMDYPSLRTQAINQAGQYNPQRILIEDTGVGTALLTELKLISLPVIGVKPERNKKTRMAVQAAKFESNLVYLPEQAPWLHDYEAELFGFPHVNFDDQVDSTSQALASNPSDFDLDLLLDGMARLNSGLAFQRLFSGRIV